MSYTPEMAPRQEGRPLPEQEVLGQAAIEAGVPREAQGGLRDPREPQGLGRVRPVWGWEMIPVLPATSQCSQ